MERTDYSIAGVSKLTGLSCHTLRVWEKRYGYPQPRRTPTGHRRYPHEQVEALRALAGQVNRGVAIRVAMEKLLGGEFVAEGVQAVSDHGMSVLDPVIVQFVDLLMAGRLHEADALYEQDAAAHQPRDVIARIIEPAMTEIGERWFRKQCEIYQERCASLFLRRKLMVMYDTAQRANASPTRVAVLGAPQGERHKGGILILSVLLELHGWRAINLSVDLPIREFHRAVMGFRAQILCLSFVLSRNISKRFQELDAIRTVPVFVGGRSIVNYQNLARKHGLIPLSGPASLLIPRLEEEYNSWKLARDKITAS